MQLFGMKIPICINENISFFNDYTLTTVKTETKMYRIIQDKYGFGIQKKVLWWWSEFDRRINEGGGWSPRRFKSAELAQKRLGEILADKENSTSIIVTNSKSVFLSAKNIVQKLWGEKAGGHELIAGSPRGQRMTITELCQLFHEFFIYS